MCVTVHTGHAHSNSDSHTTPLRSARQLCKWAVVPACSAASHSSEPSSVLTQAFDFFFCCRGDTRTSSYTQYFWNVARLSRTGVKRDRNSLHVLVASVCLCLASDGFNMACSSWKSCATDRMPILMLLLLKFAGFASNPCAHVVCCDLHEL